jgi:hypothetical protein
LAQVNRSEDHDAGTLRRHLMLDGVSLLRKLLFGQASALHGHPGRRRTLILRLARAATAMVCLLSSCGHPPTGTRRLGGPLNCQPSRNVTAESVVADVDKPFTFADVFLFNCGQDVVILDGVQLIGKDQGLDVVGLLVAGPGRHPQELSGDEVYPPRFIYPVFPLTGYRFTQSPDRSGGASTQVIIGLAVRREGVVGFRSVAILYHSGSTQYEYIVSAAAAFCSPVLRYRNTTDCKSPPLPSPVTQEPA